MKTLNKLLQSIAMIVRGAPGCRLILAALLALGLCAGKVRASDLITMTVNATNFSGNQIPYDFTGLACGYEGTVTYPFDPFHSWTVLPGAMLDVTNTEMLTLYEQTGMHHLRLNWGVQTNLAGQMTLPEVDSMFHFLQQANIKVIFTVDQVVYTNDGLAVTNWQSLTNYDMGLAQHVWTNYQANLDNFAIGNEPEEFDYRPPPFGTGTNLSDLITNYATYQSDWDGIAEAITNVCSGATFSGLDAGAYDFPSAASKGAPYSNFLTTAGAHVPVDYYTVHNYPSGYTTDPNIGVGEILSSNLLIASSAPGDYPVAQSNAMGAVAVGYDFRFDEGEDMGHGCTNASNALAGALWMLDELHWWATNKYCLGFDFQEVVPYPESVVYYNGQPSGHYEVFPKGEALKAWDLGGQGFFMVPSSVSNPHKDDATCYAVGNGQDLYLTFINKTNSTDVAFSNVLTGFKSASVAAMYMLSASGNLEASNDTTLGGVAITNNVQWQGMWTPETPATNNGWCVVSVPPSEAAVVHLRAGCAYDGPICDTVAGALYMYTVGTDNQVHESHQNHVASAPSNWYLFGSPMGNLPNNATAASGPTVVKDHYGDPTIFVVGSDSNDYRYSFVGSRTPYTWTEVTNSLGITNLQAELDPDGGVILFGLTNGNLFYTSEIAPSIPSGVWNNLGAPSGTTLQNIAAVQNLDGHVEVFGVDTGGNLWHIYQRQGNNWNTWGSWSELDANGAHVDPGIQVVRNLYGNLYVFGVDTSSGGIDYIDQGPGGSGGWSLWDTTDVGKISNTGSGIPADPGFVVAQNNDGRFEIFAVGGNGDGNLWHIYNPSTTSFNWSSWGNLGGASSPTPNAQLVVGNTIDSGRVQVFAIGSNGDVWSIWQNPPPGGGWSIWTDFGSSGNGQYFYTGQP